jgi:hypothetical protein
MRFRIYGTASEFLPLLAGFIGTDVVEENVGRFAMGTEFRECRGKFTILDAISPLERGINHKRTS